MKTDFLLIYTVRCILIKLQLLLKFLQNELSDSYISFNQNSLHFCDIPTIDGRFVTANVKVSV